MDKKLKNSVLNTIASVGEEKNASFIVMGYHGRKGDKEDVTILGTTVYNTILNTKIPLFIVKEPYYRKIFGG